MEAIKKAEEMHLGVALMKNQRRQKCTLRICKAEIFSVNKSGTTQTLRLLNKETYLKDAFFCF